MLPKGFNIKNVDSKIRKLVVLLNEIPSTDTATTCEGHYPYVSGLPAKDGWIWFDSQDHKLVKTIKDFCKKYDFAEFHEKTRHPNLYLVEAHFPKTSKEDASSLVFKIAAQERKKNIEVFWKEFTQEIENYISRAR